MLPMVVMASPTDCASDGPRSSQFIDDAIFLDGSIAASVLALTVESIVNCVAALVG